MTARPILFSGEMVRALLDGRKTQTRRVVKYKGATPPAWATFAAEGTGFNQRGGTYRTGTFYWSEEQTPGAPLKPLRRWPLAPMFKGDTPSPVWIPCPYGQPGDLLWVRETWGIGYEDGEGGYSAIQPNDGRGRKAFYAADFNDPPDGARRPWKPSIHMPRWASRLTLRITSVRVERVQEISEADAKAEGVHKPWPLAEDDPRTHIDAFGDLWDSLNAARGYGWQANPWVWAVSFQVIRANVDSINPVARPVELGP